ncbi:metalloendopeptidase-like membrane protein [Terriglobus roseus DSM 18391]|uniref:Metalloendopeptidase-like membrane protein n=1 Tax=Terriglobus roseus (strain DSM 18391 / NRRL B-41598 / KBS 63) TaxID=926566 RepID=I3ZEE9_TERRK|nr:M23 family metallopeptidase [Terriglobus roseus]AFL87617.1 metalloendopeptidase-like membrane protein [Terriglobus roseus DSM 18391]
MSTPQKRLVAAAGLLLLATTTTAPVLAQDQFPDRGPGLRVVPNAPPKVAVAAVAAPPATPAPAAAKAPAAHGSPAVKNIFWQPNDLKQGSPALITVELLKPATRVTGTFAGKSLLFFRGDDPKLWHALAGDDVETQPGSYQIAIAAIIAGRPARDSRKVEIAAGTFKTGDVEVPDNFVNPSAEEKRQIARDDAWKTKAYAHNTLKPLWSGNFQKPVAAPSTESFGESRILNEERSSLHRGTDYPVKEGTPVLAANAGIVVLAETMFYEGNCVIIDHGDRFFTIYMHLEKLGVKEGDRVEKGARLGLSGSTGRVTGPHMHFGVRWNGAYLDPVQLLALTLPATAAKALTPPAKPATPRRR